MIAFSCKFCVCEVFCRLLLTVNFHLWAVLFVLQELCFLTVNNEATTNNVLGAYQID